MSTHFSAALVGSMATCGPGTLAIGSRSLSNSGGMQLSSVSDNVTSLAPCTLAVLN